MGHIVTFLSVPPALTVTVLAPGLPHLSRSSHPPRLSGAMSPSKATAGLGSSSPLPHLAMAPAQLGQPVSPCPGLALAHPHLYVQESAWEWGCPGVPS